MCPRRARIKKTIYTIFARANAARLLSAVEETVSRYKGRQSAKAVEKDFRHFVGMVVPPGGLGNRLDAMYEFQTARQLKGAAVCFRFRLYASKRWRNSGHSRQAKSSPEMEPG
jgi:hypothetical protein